MAQEPDDIERWLNVVGAASDSVSIMTDEVQAELQDESWPVDGSPISFPALIEPICAAIRFAYGLQRQNNNLDIPWTGPEIGRPEQATCLPAQQQLRAENLAYSLDEQGRDALTEIVSLAVRLGIEQGRRITMTGEYRTLRLRLDAAVAILSR